MKKAMWNLGFLSFLALSMPLSAWDTSPTWHECCPEVIWALASYGGTWVTEIQIQDTTGGSQVSVFYDYNGGGTRNVINLWTSPGAWTSVKFANILQTLKLIDPTFDYYGTSGCLHFYTQDTDHKIRVSVRIVNGNYGKTYTAVSFINANCVNTGRNMTVMDLSRSAKYRTTLCVYNTNGGPHQFTFELYNGNGGLIGNAIQITLQGYKFYAFDPFALCNAPAGDYDNVVGVFWTIYCANPNLGLMVLGATTNNYTNDPTTVFATQDY